MVCCDCNPTPVFHAVVNLMGSGIDSCDYDRFRKLHELMCDLYAKEPSIVASANDPDYQEFLKNKERMKDVTSVHIAIPYDTQLPSPVRVDGDAPDDCRLRFQKAKADLYASQAALARMDVQKVCQSYIDPSPIPSAHLDFLIRLRDMINNGQLLLAESAINQAIRLNTPAAEEPTSSKS